MSTPNDIAELLRKGIEAAREGQRAEARRYFEQVVDLDDKSEKGWFWLASVVETDEERRICLGNVLHINANNEKAKRALDALQAKAKDKQAVPGDTEVVPGLSRRRMTTVIGLGAGLVIVILVIALVVIVGNNSREAAARATAEAVAQVVTDSAATLSAAAAQATATAIAEAATQQALVTPVVPTRSLPTLPPTWTPTPQATLPPTRESLPLPTGLSGRLVVWGGQNVPSQMPGPASKLYAQNIVNIVTLMTSAGEDGAPASFAPDFDDEIVAGACVTHDGAIRHEPTRLAIEGPAPEGEQA